MMLIIFELILVMFVGWVLEVWGDSVELMIRISILLGKVGLVVGMLVTIMMWLVLVVLLLGGCN